MFDSGVGTVQMDKEDAERLQVLDVAEILEASAGTGQRATD